MTQETKKVEQPPQQSVQIVAQEKTISDSVLNKITLFKETGAINIPKDYSPANALKAAWLVLLETKTMDKKPVLNACSKESIANALLKMVVLGLNPVKRQCSFIAYGNQLQCQREYAGTIAIAKRDSNVKSVSGAAIFDGDEFEYLIDPETLERKIVKHVQTIDSLGSQKVKGAYAVILYNDGKRKIEIMAMPQIQKAWEQGATKGNSPAHKNFPDQMAIKTVINRALKIDVNSSDDAAFMEDDETVQTIDVKAAHVQQMIEDNSNREEIGFDESENAEEEFTTESSNEKPNPGF
jgi:recombination protein RecT